MILVELFPAFDCSSGGCSSGGRGGRDSDGGGVVHRKEKSKPCKREIVALK